MKQLLIVRVPVGFPPAETEPLNNRLSARLNSIYDVIVVIESGIERIEFDIVFNPHFKCQNDQVRQFNQVDTSTNAYMEGRQ